MNLRVLIVDDSRVFRSIVKEVIEKIPGVTVVGSVWNGEKALEFLQENSVDLITLDVEMPQMNGLETLQNLREYQAKGRISTHPAVLMLSSLTAHGASTTITALDNGAFDFIQKPDISHKDPQRYLLSELRDKIRSITESGHTGKKTVPQKEIATPILPNATIHHGTIQIIAIGVSTGGPKSLMSMLPELCKVVSCPIVIVQHMPPMFTLSLAQSLDKICSHSVVEAADNEKIEGPKIFIAPGGRHLTVQKKGTSFFTSLNDQPPESGCRPSVDVLFRSVANAYGGNSIAIILTGMGSDGTAGIRPLKRAGASIIVQDEASSVVWGMPGSAFQTGLVDRVSPLMEIPQEVTTFLKGRS